MRFQTCRPLNYKANDRYCAFTLPQGTPVILVKQADGVLGDLWAVRDARTIIDLTGNTHDPVYRYTFVPADAVEIMPEDGA